MCGKPAWIAWLKPSRQTLWPAGQWQEKMSMCAISGNHIAKLAVEMQRRVFGQHDAAPQGL